VAGQVRHIIERRRAGRLNPLRRERRVMTTLKEKYESIFPSAKKPWYQTADDEDAPK
jgi:hypothetical protein